MDIFDKILRVRGLVGEKRQAFLNPDYSKRHDPFLLPDMAAAVDRIELALSKQQHISIYGDYDIDGLTATTLLLDAFESFGFKNVRTFVPNRFVEGYGMTMGAVEKIANDGCDLIITVDCGSLSHEPIMRARELGVDVIVTDHHNVAAKQPPAVAVINPKRLLQEFPDRYDNFILKDSSDTSKGTKQPDKSNRAVKLYPFLDLPGVGVAFKLVQALQTRLGGLEVGQEKWLLDLVALGTVCDVVTLKDENRLHVYWGLEVLKKTRRPGLKALMAVSGVDPEKVNARSLGFALGPRMNAAGRLETAQIALDMLCAVDGIIALEKAHQLDEMNGHRRAEQDKIFKQAVIMAQQYENDAVLVLSAPGWNHGIIGIVAAKILEKFSKPTFVLEEMGDESKGSARSYGDFSAADAIRAAESLITKGGGHKLAAGVTLPTDNIEAFRKKVNEYYSFKKLDRQLQQGTLLPTTDAEVTVKDISKEFVDKTARLEPFGNGNPKPVLQLNNLKVQSMRRMGNDGQHVKLRLEDENGLSIDAVAFSAHQHFFVEPGRTVRVWLNPEINEWRGIVNIEGRLLNVEEIT